MTEIEYSFNHQKADLALATEEKGSENEETCMYGPE